MPHACRMPMPDAVTARDLGDGLEVQTMSEAQKSGAIAAEKVLLGDRFERLAWSTMGPMGRAGNRRGTRGGAGEENAKSLRGLRRMI
ncbi:hypothetical protein THAOC_11197 [Thalassiosira oceanica]|uniref:Uncharacterized protein n=1 Tax=Thalassiosira oceanica TaxID=159749 RepID=K0TBA3_THAOC|nr:hypothetical protein THAOC_11197 [Thalassiosira oceanica]|eukprot:EJK67732.1 hypothetical protein THAOC_11197 [Thalassiosira oceanica]